MAKSQAKLWRVQALNDVECLKAVGINHAFDRHIHTGFGLAVVDQGRLAYRTEAGDHFLKPGDVLVINPGQVHWGGTVDGDRYGQAIADVAIDTGFADQSHFTRHFKRFVRVTPGQYVSGQ
ncbi:MAG: helix-turn-helix transcriptional regulator [Cyanobacteria bacterium P01_A01_bin.123]